MFRHLLLGIIALGLVEGAAAQNWPSFRGPNASGISPAKHVPVIWNAETGRNVLWKTPIPGLGHSSPVVWGDHVFVTTSMAAGAASRFQADASGGRNVVDDSEKHTWRLYALDRKTGKILWERVAHEGVPRVKRHVRSSHANATPATDGKHVVTFFGSEGLYVYDFAGKLLWKRNLGVLDAGYVGLPEYQWETASSPIIYRNLVIVQCDSRSDSFVAAYDIATGKPVWRSPRDENPSWATPIIVRVANRDLLITSSPRYFRGMDPLTGKEIWRFADGADVKVPTPVAGDGLVYFSGGAPQGRQFYAIRPSGSGDISAKGDGESPQLAWRVDKGGPYTPTPILVGDYFYVLGDIGVLSCYDADTGKEIYRRRISDAGGTYSASPVAANGHLYLSQADGSVFVVRAGREFKVVSANPMGESLLATPALTEGMVLIRTQHHLVAIGG